jgi:hypothetical protein
VYVPSCFFFGLLCVKGSIWHVSHNLSDILHYNYLWCFVCCVSPTKFSFLPLFLQFFILMLVAVVAIAMCTLQQNTSYIRWCDPLVFWYFSSRIVHSDQIWQINQHFEANSHKTTNYCVHFRDPPIHRVIASLTCHFFALYCCMLAWANMSVSPLCSQATVVSPFDILAQN